MLRKVAVSTDLAEQAVRLGDHKTKEEAAMKALEYYIGCLERERIAGDSGVSGFNPDCNGV